MEKKKKGNACRTKNQIRNSKSQGSAFEYDCQASLELHGYTVTRTAERGYQRQYDLFAEISMKKIAIECKRLKGISWNQLVKLHQNLVKAAPEMDDYWILFKSHFQPCLIFDNDDGYRIREFEGVFGTPFIKHESTRVKK